MGGPGVGPDPAGRDGARCAVRDGQIFRWSLWLAIRWWARTSQRACFAQARARGIASRLEHVAQQDLPYVAEFDAVLTVDAMEDMMLTFGVLICEWCALACEWGSTRPVSARAVKPGPA